MNIRIENDTTPLEATLQGGSGGSSRAVLLLHPHPLYGGDMHNDVIMSMERLFHSLDLLTLKFNFRGAGESGSYVGPYGSVQDVFSAIRFLENDFGVSEIGVVGYSFGGSIALASAIKQSFDFCITLSASLQLLNEACDVKNMSGEIECPCFLFHGDHDDVVPIDDMYQISKIIGRGSKTFMIEGEGHYYRDSIRTVCDQSKLFVEIIWDV
ncbi:MAG: alpha/beta hydrolase [Candidatus Thorarchaeota archaeon]